LPFTSHTLKFSEAEYPLAKSLEIDAQVHRKATGKKREEEVLAEWNELQPVYNSYIPRPFKDPLGHLTFEEQVAYLANPSDEYLQTLEDRARVREMYEKTVFLADPLTQWKLAYNLKPRFEMLTLPEWKPWNMERKVQVMEKYRGTTNDFRAEYKRYLRCLIPWSYEMSLSLLSNNQCGKRFSINMQLHLARRVKRNGMRGK
jgi:hypothetical protein